MYARPDQIGHEAKCPDCHAMNLVEDPIVVVERKVFATDGDELKLADDQPLVPASTEPYPVRCRVCETLVYCRPEQQGKQTICPDCDSIILVPAPPPPKKKVTLTDAPSIDIQPTFDLPVHKSNADKLLSKAEEKVKEELRKKQKPPKRPFVDDVASFPFHPRVLPGWLIVTLLAALVMKLFLMGIELAESGGLDSIIGIPVLAAWSVLTLTLVLLASNIYMSIIYWTAMGYRTIEDWGGVEPWTWVRRGLFFVNAMAVSCVPGGVLSWVLPGRWPGFIVSGVIIFFVFPYMLLCMLDEETPVTLYSAYIWKTTRLVRSAWKKFYAITGAICLGVIGLQLATLSLAWALGWDWLNYLPLAAAAVALVWYFRLLGRLAWVLDEYHAQLPPEDEEEEAVGSRFPLNHSGQLVG
jgi:hypothetical protein